MPFTILRSFHPASFLALSEKRFQFLVDKSQMKVYNCINKLVQKEMEIHMKKPIHLYIFAVLSLIASVLRIYTVFFSKFDEAQIRSGLEAAGITGGDLDGIIGMSKASNAFTTNIINKILVVALFAILIAAIVFLFKKANEKASYTYIAYLFGTLIYFTYSFIGTNQISKIHETAEMQGFTKSAALMGYGINILLFVIYFGVTVFFLVRKPKVTPDMSQTATDI
jgi:hypothetical protein